MLEIGCAIRIHELNRERHRLLNPLDGPNQIQPNYQVHPYPIVGVQAPQEPSVHDRSKGRIGHASVPHLV